MNVYSKDESNFIIESLPGEISHTPLLLELQYFLGFSLEHFPSDYFSISLDTPSGFSFTS